MLMAVKKVDFHAVEPHQRAMDLRLHNWGRWCNGTYAPMTSPMFRMTPPAPLTRGDIPAGGAPVDRMDAAKIAKEVAKLPEKHRAAVNWCYVKPVSPHRACRAIGVGMEELANLLRNGRQMLINRDV